MSSIGLARVNYLPLVLLWSYLGTIRLLRSDSERHWQN